MDYGRDIFSEAETDPDTLENLGPLKPMAGVWEGEGQDRHPAADGAEENTFFEHYELQPIDHYELQPIDAQTNGPQLFYGLRYHTHIVKPGEVETFHDQVGYWLWEPATRSVTFTLGIPRGQVLLASGPADMDSKSFELQAQLGSETYGILSNPFLDRSFRTLSYRIEVTIHADRSWSYEEEGRLEIPGVEGVFSHIDRNTLTQVAPPNPNPLAARRTGAP